MTTKTLPKPLILKRRYSISRPYLVILLSLCVFAFTPIMIQLALDSGFSPVVITSGRLMITLFFLTPLVLRNHIEELRQSQRKTILLTIASGTWLSFHFITMMFSLEHTSILLNQVIIATSPLWIAILEVLFFRSRIHKLVWIGIVLAVFGSSIIAFTGSHGETSANNHLLGIFLAVISAMGMGLYLVIGKRARENLSFIPYVWLLYLSGTLVAIVVTIITQTSVTP